MLACLVGGVLFVAAFLTGLAIKERDDTFCVACHLHEKKFERLVAAHATDLAAFHRQRKPEVGCIACHGGADLRMRVRVWKLAAFDTLKFVAGRYREPGRMQLPLRDAECRQCHSPILRERPAPTEAGAPRPAPSAAIDPSDESTFAAEAQMRGGNSYHAIRDHDSVDVRCVACHVSHATDGDEATQFISKATVTPICRRCHRTL